MISKNVCMNKSACDQYITSQFKYCSYCIREYTNEDEFNKFDAHEDLKKCINFYESISQPYKEPFIFYLYQKCKREKCEYCQEIIKLYYPIYEIEEIYIYKILENNMGYLSWLHHNKSKIKPIDILVKYNTEIDINKLKGYIDSGIEITPYDDSKEHMMIKLYQCGKNDIKKGREEE